ncbi:MAG: chemotaxis protein CheB, partial [Chloroflexota bacterium]
MVVGIGASAGGLEALQDFFKNAPVYSGLAFVVIQHLSPDYKSLMDELLARQTAIPIHIATDGMAVERDNIYLIPPRKNISIFHDQLFLEDQGSRKGLNLPVDIFFRSLALEKGKNAVGIILSGTGSDGTLGTRAIKEAGGMVMVQDEKSAKFDGMPRSSISTGLVDYILSPDKMPEALVNFIKHP